MKKLMMAVFVMVLFVPCVVGAIPLNTTIPCESGSIAVVGDYNAVTGAFTLSFALNNCNSGNGALSGTASSSGTLKFTSATTASANISINSQITRTGEGNNVTENCTLSFTGTYNLVTFVLDGSEIRNCNGNGTGTLDLLQLLSGIELL